MNTPYRPEIGYIGDVVPFFWQGQHHLFYLRALDDPAVAGIARWVGSGWNHVVSDDLVNWRELPPAFGPGPSGSQDFHCCATGRIIEREGIFHAFYPGFNLEREPRSAICHAWSRDLLCWEKDSAGPILTADPRWYDPSAISDPFVFWNEDAGSYWMLMTASIRSGPQSRRGCVALATSPDLSRWELQPPFWAPGLASSLEVPNLFRLGNRWYLTFSVWTNGRMAAMYRSAESLAGPWCAPGDGQMDSAQWYGMNTGGDGRRRLIFGWVPTLEGSQWGGMWQWGGHMGTPRELLPAPDGGLHLRCPPEALAQYVGADSDKPYVRPEPKLGDWTMLPAGARCVAPDSFGYALLPPGPDPCCLEADIAFEAGTQRVGFLLRTEPDLSRGYLLYLEPQLGRVVIDHWPRPDHEPPALTRPLDLGGKREIHCRILLNGTVIEAFVDDRVVLSARAYAPMTWPSGLIVQEGSASFEGLVRRAAADQPGVPGSGSIS